ncbi:MAG TPA: TPM domain-containing protein [Rhodanobacteraceae bacterium]|nr:TPM domain-containing protein [Rhodanobacteraceae bacterium]
MDPVRWLRHWLHAPASRAFPPDAMQEVRDAIAQGEAKHDGEICFAVEARLPARYLIGGRRVRERAESVFADLKVWDTERRTGVLIYVLLGDYTIEIIPDRGVAARIQEGAWTRITSLMSEQFRAEHWKEGALAGIEATHKLLELYLPPGPGRRDALPKASVVQ